MPTLDERSCPDPQLIFTFVILKMELREIGKRLRKLSWDSLMAAVDKVPRRNQMVESGCHAATCDWEEYGVSERRLEIPRQSNRHDSAPSAFMERRTEIAAGGSAKAKTQVCAGDVARGILGPDSGATISNVLVVRTDGSLPLKRTEIHLKASEQVPAVFNQLLTALQSSGFDFEAARISGIPATEIWLTSSLDNRKKTWLYCGASGGVDGFRNGSPGPILREPKLNEPAVHSQDTVAVDSEPPGFVRIQQQRAIKGRNP